jgi:hypothetical protein
MKYFATIRPPEKLSMTTLLINLSLEIEKK